MKRRTHESLARTRGVCGFSRPQAISTMRRDAGTPRRAMEQPKRFKELKIQTVCLIVVTAFVIGISLYLLRPILVPFTLAVFLAFILSPLLDLQVRKLHLPRYIALAVTLVLGFAVLSVFSGLIVTSMTRFANNADDYEQKVEGLVQDSAVWLRDTLGFEEDEDFTATSFFPADFLELLLGRAASAITGIVSQGVLVLLFVIFLLLGRTTPTRPLTGTPLEIEGSVKQYLITKVIVSAMTGFVTYLILNFLSIPYAMAFGAFAFLLNFIPSIGSMIATFLPLPIILPELGESITTLQALMAIVLPGAVQFTIGNIIEPKLMGDSLDLHPVVILLALIFWGMIWGPIGMLLAAPLTAITKIVLSKIEVTAPIADLLAGRLESLYAEI